MSTRGGSSKSKAPIPQYTGTSLKQIEALTDGDVLTELKRLGEEPRRPMTPFYDEDHWDCTVPPPHWTEGQIQEVRNKCAAMDRSIRRQQLHIAYIEEWVRSLPVKVRWQIVEEYERRAFPWRTDGSLFSESDKRHTTEIVLNRRCTHAVWSNSKEPFPGRKEIQDDTQQTRSTTARRRPKGKASTQGDVQFQGESGALAETDQKVPSSPSK